MVSYRRLKKLRETDSEVIGNCKSATLTFCGVTTWIGLVFLTWSVLSVELRCAEMAFGDPPVLWQHADLYHLSLE